MYSLKTHLFQSLDKLLQEQLVYWASTTSKNNKPYSSQHINKMNSKLFQQQYIWTTHQNIQRHHHHVLPQTVDPKENSRPKTSIFLNCCTPQFKESKFLHFMTELSVPNIQLPSSLNLHSWTPSSIIKLKKYLLLNPWNLQYNRSTPIAFTWLVPVFMSPFNDSIILRNSQNNDDKL